jgi:hypothetical protein
MRAGIAVLLLLSGPEMVAAQLCVGNTTFALSGLQSGANIDLDKLAQNYALELRVSYHQLLAALDVGVRTWEASSLNGTSRALGLTLGLHSPHRRHSKFELCPLLHFRSLWGPNEIGGTSWSYSETSFSGELSAGYLLVRKRLWDVMPTAALSIGTGNPRLTTVYGGNLDQYQDFCCGWRTLTVVRLGVGLGFSDEVTLVPELALPLGASGQKVYLIRATLRLGKNGI